MNDFREYSDAFYAQNDELFHYGIPGMKWHKRGAFSRVLKKKKEQEKREQRLSTVESASQLGDSTMVKPKETKPEEKKSNLNLDFKNAKNVRSRDPLSILVKAGSNIASNLNKTQKIDTARVNAAFKASGRKEPIGSSSLKTNKDDKKRRRGRYADRNK